MTPLKIYIASRFLNARIVKALSTKLMSLAPVRCVQTWPDERDDCGPAAAALRDLFEIEKSDMVVVYTIDCEGIPGGMHFEAGYAYGQGKRIVVIGPLVNIFYYLPDVERYDNIQDFLKRISGFLKKNFNTE